MKQALRRKDLTYVVREGLMQKDHGAHILDVNVGLPKSMKGNDGSCLV